MLVPLSNLFLNLSVDHYPEIVPQPWDSSLSFNFTTNSCLSFFTVQLANTTFRACRPFGMLLQSSSAFFQAETNLTELTAVLGGTCDTPQSMDQCNDIMSWMASMIVQPGVCGADIAQGNSMALAALNGK